MPIEQPVMTLQHPVGDEVSVRDRSRWNRKTFALELAEGSGAKHMTVVLRGRP